MEGKQKILAGCLTVKGVPQHLPKNKLTELIGEPEANILKYKFQEGDAGNKCVLLLDSPEDVERLCDEIQEAERIIDTEKYKLTYHRCDESDIPGSWLEDEDAAGIKPYQPDSPELQHSVETEKTDEWLQRQKSGKIKLSNLSEDIDEEYLELYFEQEFGNDIKINSVALTGNNTTAIMEVAKQGMIDLLMERQPFNMDGQMVSVESFVTQELKQTEAKTIEVTADEGVITEKSFKTIKMYFSNNGRSGGGTITECTLSKESETIRITYESAQDSETLKKRAKVENKRETPKAIKITNLPLGVDRSLLEVYFEDAATFGEQFHVVDVDVDPETKTAIIEFEEPEAIEVIVQRGELDIEGQTVYIEAIEEQIQQDPCTVEVRGPEDCITDKSLSALKMYFNNKRRSGGGEVTDCCLVEPGLAEITFETNEAAKRVVDKDDHTLKSQHLQVALKPPVKNQIASDVSNKLLISGVNASVRDILTLHLEDAFEDVQVLSESPGEDESKFVIEVDGTKSAETILKNQPICIEGHTLSVQKYTDDQQHMCTIQVLGLPDIDKHLDALKLYFRNKRRSGGGPIVKCTVDKDRNVAYITFETEEVAQSVVKKTEHNFKQKRLDVLLYNPKQAPHNSQEESRPNKILITGLPSQTDEEFLGLFFEDLDSDCDIQVQSVTINPESASAILEFSDPAAVDFIIRCPRLIFKENPILVQVYHAEKEEYCTIQVHGPSKIESHLDRMRLYFRNRRRSGGGVIVKSYVDTGKDVLFLTFESQEVAKRVVAEDHSKQGLEVSLATDQSPADESTYQTVKTVKVRGVKEEISRETLKYYFENKKRSGGGPIESITNDEEDENSVYITFALSEDAGNVVGKQHNVQDCTLHVSLYVPPPFYDNKVLIKGMRSTKDALFLFLEAKVNAEPVSIDYHEEEEETVLVTMKDKIDFEKLEKACKNRRLEGAALKVSKIQVSNCIFVSNLAPDVTKDTIQYYFENKQKCGGGYVENVVVNEEDEEERTCLVYFEDYKVIDKILQRQHTLGNKLLEVKCFQKILGRPEGEHTDRVFHVPSAFEVKDANSHKVKFAATSKENRSRLEQELIQYYTKVIWPSDTGEHIQLQCTLTKEVKGCFRIAKTWRKEAALAFERFMEGIVLHHIDVLQDIKQTVVEFIKTIQVNEPTNVALLIESEQKAIFIVGMKDVADGLKVKIEFKVKKIIEDAEKERQKIKEIFTYLKPIETKMMLLEQVPQSLEKDFNDLKVQIEVVKNEIHLHGAINSVQSAKLNLFDRKSRFDIRRIDNVSQLCSSLLVSENTITSLQQKLKSSGIPAVWEIGLNEVQVCSSNPWLCGKAVEVIRSSINENTIMIEKGSVPDLQTEKWRINVHEITSKHPGLVKVAVSDNYTQIHVCAITDVAKSVYDDIQRFLQSSTIVTKNISHSKEAHRLVEKHIKSEIEAICRQLQQYYVKIKVMEQYKGFEIRGLPKGVGEAVSNIQKLFNRIIHKTHTVTKPGIAEHIRSRKGKDSIHTIESTLPCVIAVEGDDAYKHMTDKVHGNRTHASCNVFRRNIYVWQGDMTELDVDVLVNPSDKDLGFSGGLGKALISKGGQGIRQECESFKTNYGVLKDGEVFMSSAGTLKAKHIAHIKSQQWQPGMNREKEVETTVFKCLTEASDMGANSIAFPAIGCGVNGFPVDIATSSIVSALMTVFYEQQSCSLDDIYLCDMNVQNVQGFTNALCKVFGRKNVVLHDSVAVMSDISHTTSGDGFIAKTSGAIPKRFTASRRHPYADAMTRSQTTPIWHGQGTAFGNIMVTVVKGEIAKQKVDAIVNTTSFNLNLLNGAVSLTLLKTAGQELQDEVSRKYPNGIKGTDIAVTGGHKLKCKIVMHTALSNFNEKKPKESIKALSKLTMTCLEEVQRRNLCSIALPAFGTGSLRFPRSTVAVEMFKSVSKFQKNNPRSSVADVRFIVYQMDTQTVTAFESEQLRLQTEVKWKSLAAQPGSDASSHGYDVVQADSGGYGDNSGSYSFGSITVSVKQGDITEEDTDCIVNSTNEALNLQIGIKLASSTLMAACIKYPTLKYGYYPFDKYLYVNQSLVRKLVHPTTFHVKLGHALHSIVIKTEFGPLVARNTKRDQIQKPVLRISSEKLPYQNSRLTVSCLPPSVLPPETKDLRH